MKDLCLSPWRVVLIALLGCLCIASGALAGPVAYIDGGGEIFVTNHPKAVDAVSALSLLSSPPPSTPFTPALTSAVPPGTKLLDFRIEGNKAVVNFSRGILVHELTEERLAGIFDQVKATLWNYGFQGEVAVNVEGTPLAEYVAPTPVIEPRKEARVLGLGGRSITLSPGHGWFWNGSGWYTQRPVYCSPLNEEDFHTLEICQYIQTYLAQDGMTVKMVRCTNKNYGTCSYSGKPWWQMAACYWLQHVGYPCSVYGSYSGCTLGSGSTEINDDIRSRPLASDYDGTNIYISLHTNGYSGDCYGSSCPTGTITYYDCSTEHASWCTVSQNLANAVHDNLIDTIRNKIPISDWTNRGKANSNGAYGEIRIPDRAAILIELAFHDTCDRDAVYLRDNFFRSACAWGIYKGVCAYFGQTPTWDFYSDELVSHDIPTQMNTGEVRTVHITFRNRGVLWTEAKAIRLGAVGDSDPFTTQTRHTISGEVGPNQTYTWTFNLTAPTTPGQYVTDWRMVRDGVTWFGATCSQTINVVASDSQAPSVPTNLSATVKSPSRIDLAWNASTDNIGVTGYKIYRNGGQIGTSASTSYVDSSCSANASYTYTVAAYDAAGNTSGQSSPAFATTPPSEIVIDNPSCELSGVWSTGTSATDKYGADYYFASSAVSEGKTATWRPNFAFGGSYDVYAWWPAGTNRAPNAPYTVAWSGGSQVVQMNQQSNGGQWNSLVSSKTFAMGTGGYVRLSNGTGQTGYVVMADAVRWVTLSVDTVAPSVPTNVAANPVSCTQINLTWNASTDNVAIGGYKIYRNGVQVGTSAATSYSDTDCSPGTTYTYRVSAYDTAGNESAQSSQVAATTPGDTTAPSVPTNLSANAVSGTQVDLTWTASTDNIGVAGYKIYRNGSQIGTSSSTSYSDTTCSPGQSYTYEVSAYDAASNESAKSTPAVVTTPGVDTIAPSVPTNLSATAVSGTQVDLSWTASTDNVGVVGYKVYRNGVQVGTSVGTSYSDTGCVPATSYTYEVSAYDAASNESAKSTPATVVTPDTIAPSVPTNLSATAVSGTQVDLSWTASTDNVGVVGYKVYRNGVQVGTSTGTSYSDTGCVPATSYTYEVSAYDAASNESAKSTPATVVTPDTIAPSVPTNLSATAVSGTQVNLSWTASTDNVGVVGYKVYRNGVQVGTSTGTSYSDTGCVPATSYTYEVSAYDAASNESAKSTPATVVTPDTIAPSVPTNLSATAVSGTQVNLSWTASTDNVGVVGYKVYRNGVQVGTSTGTSYSDTGCVPATSYTYEVSAYDAASNESAKSAPATVVTPDTIAPSVPTNLQASAVSQTQINLSWTASTDNVGVVGYKIYRNGAQIATSTTTSYSDTTCESYTTYTYRVSAYDGSNNESGLSNQATATTLPYTDIILDNNVAVYVGTWFTGTSATDKYGSDYRYGTTDTVESRTATWTPDIDISGYYTVYAWWPQGSNRSSAAPYTIYWDGGSQTVAVNQKTNGGMWNTLVTNKRFLAGTGQSVKLSNNTGEASLNVMADAVRFLLVSDDLTPPSVPSNVSAVGVSASQVNVSWTASTDNVGVSGYKVYRNGVQVATTASTSYSDTGLSELTTYTYEVSAYDAMGNESAKSAQATGTTLDGTPPSVPSGVTATAVGPQRINLTWTASTDNVGVAGYKVYRNGSYIGYTASTSYSDGGLSPSTSYTYTISAYDAASNESSQSSGASATTPGYANVIVDNPACTFTGVWTIATASTDKYGSDYAYASTAVSEGKTAKWIPSIPYSGNYDTYIWYPQGSNRATNAPFTLYWDGGSQTVAWNQQTNGGAWRLLLGNKHFVAGTSCYLKLGNGTGATGFIVVADGARFQQISGD